MTIAQGSIIAGGVLSLLMAVFHTRFYSLFGWTKEFEAITKFSGKVIFTVHVALILLFLVFSIVSFANFAELARCNGVSLSITLLYSLFWLWRSIWQVTYLRPPKKVAKKSSLIRHYVLLFVFILLCVLYAMPFMIKTF